MRIDGNHRCEAVTRRDRCQADGRFSLEAADLENDAARGRAGRDEREKARLALGEESRGRAYAGPRFLDRLVQTVGC